MMFDVEGKVGLITGGASGIGLACVKEFLKNGMKGVAIVDVNEEAGLKVLEDVKKEFGEDKALFLKVDVSDKDQFEDAFKKTIEKFKNLDVLVNNAGVFNEKNWEKTVAVNVNGNIIGNLLGFETYIPKYKSGSEGVIVNVCSIASVCIRGFNPIYTATKHAALGLSRSFGMDQHYKRTKVRVISICPGPTETPLAGVLENFSISEDYSKIYTQIKSSLVQQSPNYIASSTVKLIEKAENGSVWVIENYEEPYELEFPSRVEMRKKN